MDMFVSSGVRHLCIVVCPLQSTQQVQMSQFAVAEKETLARSQLVDTLEKEEPSNNDDDKGTFFEVIYVPTIDTKKEDALTTSFSGEGEERKFALEHILVSRSVYLCAIVQSIRVVSTFCGDEFWQNGDVTKSVWI